MWIRVDDKLANHPKILRAGAGLGGDGAAIALGMFHWGLSYSCEYFTDGFLPREIVAGCRHTRRPLKVAAVFEAVNLWEAIEGGWRIHDFHDWNLSADEAREFRSRKAEAGHRGGVRSGQVRAKQTPKQNGSSCFADASVTDEANGQANAKQNGSSRARDPHPHPHPHPSTEKSGAATAARPSGSDGNGNGNGNGGGPPNLGTEEVYDEDLPGGEDESPAPSTGRQASPLATVRQVEALIRAQRIPLNGDDGEAAELVKLAMARADLEHRDPRVITKAIASQRWKRNHVRAP